jgi:dTDP-glucose 4,6-dehydratase
MLKKILITGACGFIGSHLTEFMLNKGFKVTAYDLYNSKGSVGWLENIRKNKKLEIVLGDVRDYKSTLDLVKKTDYVFHLAALISIPYSYNAPYSFFQTNVEGTYNLLEACRVTKKKIIITSTSEVYGSGRFFPMNESHPLNAQSPYAASKISADQLALSYNRSYNTQVNIIRPFNTFGPRQSSRAIIPNILKQAISKDIINLGNLSSKRDLLYVSDLCEAYYSLFKREKKFGKIYNVGTEKTYSILQIINKIEKTLHKKIKIKVEKKRIRPVKSEVDKLLCDFKKIKKEVLWEPKIDLLKGIKKTYSWFQKNKDEYDNNVYNI